VARRRKNIVPIMADANRPEEYAPFMETVDLLYQDVAQPNQVEIAERNLIFLKQGGHLVLMLKTRSVDVRRDPAEVLAEARVGLERRLDVADVRWLEPYHHDHAAIVCSRRE